MATRLAAEPELKGQTIVVVLPASSPTSHGTGYLEHCTDDEIDALVSRLRNRSGAREDCREIGSSERT